MIETSIKKKINDAVEDYMAMHREEYSKFLRQMEWRRQNLDNEYAALKNDGHTIIRALYEIPETLSVMIAKKLTDKEFDDANSLEFDRWFAENYPQFRLTSKV